MNACMFCLLRYQRIAVLNKCVRFVNTFRYIFLKGILFNVQNAPINHHSSNTHNSSKEKTNKNTKKIMFYLYIKRKENNALNGTCVFMYYMKVVAIPAIVSLSVDYSCAIMARPRADLRSI